MKRLLIFCTLLTMTDCDNFSNRTRTSKWKDRLNRSLFVPKNSFFAVNSHQPLLTCDYLRARAVQREISLYDLTYGTSSTPSCAPTGWNAFFFHYSVRRTVKRISDSLVQEIEYGHHVNPRIGSIFRALVLVPVDHVRVIVLGDSPASRKGIATGLAFSLEPTVPAVLVPSVHRLLLELRNERFCVNSENADLTPWVGRGVLLLNSALSVRAGGKLSHTELWRPFTTELIKFISAFAKPSAWILFGKRARSFRALIDRKKHYVLTGSDPSTNASSGQFFCGNYFNCANKWLSAKGRGVVEWNLLRNSQVCFAVLHKPFTYTALDSGVDNFRVTIETECKMRSCPGID